MSGVLGVLQFVAIAWACVYELRKKSIAIFIWAVLMIMFGFTHMISVISGNYDYSLSTMNKASIFVILFTSIYIIARMIFSRKINNETIENKLKLTDREEYISIKFMYILLYILIFSILVRCVDLIRTAGGSIFSTSWETMRQTGGEYFSISQIFMPFFLLSSSCLCLAIKYNNKKVIAFSTIAILFEVLISRNRIEILPLLVAIIYIIILKINKITLKRIFLLCCIGIVGIYSIYALRVFRHAGTISKFFEHYNIITFNKTILEYFKNDDGELGLRNYMYYFIENNNNFENFEKGHTYGRMALALVPTKWSFGLKPPDFAISMGTAVNSKAKGFSVHPTLFGDVYANFGTYGFLFGVFWALAVTIIDILALKRNKILFLPFSMIWACVYIIQARGSVYNGYVWGVYASIILICIYIIFKWVNKVEKINK